MTATARTATATRPETQYTKEQRMSVVMYGGVSLAIYIGGVAKELLALVRASGRAADDPSRALGWSDLDGVERIYRKLAQWDGAPGTSPLDIADGDDTTPLRTRYLVDIVSGTSAGGINGVFLARALAENRTLDAISDLWIQEGDISTLMNDGKSLTGMTGLTLQDPPVSLLNGQRMYRLLLNAFGAMAPAKAKINPGDRVDLYVTTTDVRGEVVRLPLANGYATEKRYKQGFHFVYEPSAERNDFADGRKARLAFAARCTSSFPFAFEPFTWNDAARLSGSDDPQWSEDLVYNNANYASRPLCDGGYLDNKPFSYVVDEMAKRHSDLPAARTLFYVEPDPEVLDEASQKLIQETKPNAIENALSALISLPGYETIREDIERVLGRNKRVDLLQQLTADIEQHLAANPTQETGAHHGVSYIAYHRMKRESVKTWFSELVCTAASVGEARLEQVVRELVSRWVEDTYANNDKQLLLDLDFAYRMRKLAFLLRRSNNAAPELVQELKRLHDAVYDLQRTSRATIGGGAKVLFTREREALAKIADITDPAERKAALDRLYAYLHSTAADLDASDGVQSAPLDMLNTFVQQTMRPGMRNIAHELKALLAQPGAEKLKHDEDEFEQYDMVLFPLILEGNIGEPVHVDVVRISPLDVSAGGGVKKLAGTRLGHFGAFLEADWRRNDILWGRLDGAEMLIRQMMRGADEAVVKAVVAKAHEEIIGDLCNELESRLTANLTEKAPAPPATPQQQRQSDEAAVAAGKVKDRSAMVSYFAAGNGYDLGIDRARQSDNAARAGRIVEQLFSGIASEKQVSIPKAIPAVLYFIWGLVQISIPQSIPRLLWSHVGKVAFILFGLLAAGGTLLNEPEVRTLGFTGLGILTAIAIVSSLLADWFRERLSLHWRAFFHTLAAGLVVSMLFVIAATAVPTFHMAWAPAWLAQTWQATTSWLALLGKALPKTIIFIAEGAVLVAAIGLSKAAMSLRSPEAA
jgi:patatin-related protein